MAVQRKQTKNSYDQVFDFIFGVQKRKENKPFRKPSPDEAGDYLAGLIEIGTQPAIYPLESAMNTINGYITRATEIDVGGGVSVGLGSGALSNTSAYVQKEVAKARAKENVARVGGYLQHGIDGALVSLFLKSNGASGKTSAGAGMLFADIAKLKDAKKNKRGKIYGLEFGEDWKRAEENVYNRSMDLLAASIAKSNPRLSKDMLLDVIATGQRINSREDRLKETVERLKLGGLTDPREGLKVAERLWGRGEGKGDLGVYRSEKDYVGQILRGVPLGDRKLKSQYDAGIRSLVSAYNNPDAKETDKRQQKNLMFKSLKNDYNLTKEDAFSITNQLIQTPLQNTRLGVAENALYSTLVSELMHDAIESGDYGKIAYAKSAAIREVFNRPENYHTFGARVGRASLLYNWAKDTQGLASKLLSGDWERFGLDDDFKYTQIVTFEKVFDENGKQVGQYVAPARSVIGTLIGNFYYLHPNNLIKGLFLDGGLWLKMASKWDPTKSQMIVDKKSVAYFLYQTRLGNILSHWKKPFEALSSGVTSVVNPLANTIKKAVKNFLVKLLGVTGVGGMVVDFLMRVLGDEIAKVVAQITMVIILGILGVFLIVTDFASGVFYSEDLTKAYLNSQAPPPVEIEYEGDIQNVFVESDFPTIP